MRAVQYNTVFLTSVYFIVYFFKSLVLLASVSLCFNGPHLTLALPYFSAWIGIKSSIKFGTCEIFDIIMSRKLNVENRCEFGI